LVTDIPLGQSAWIETKRREDLENPGVPMDRGRRHWPKSTAANWARLWIFGPARVQRMALAS